MRTFLIAGSLALLGVLVGCRGETDDSPENVGGTPGASGSGGEDEEYVEYVVPTSEDELTLLACEVEQPCEFRAISQQVEGSSDATVGGTACLFEALATGRAGRYLHQTEHAFTNGSYGAKHTVIVMDDGTAFYARTPYGGYGLETWFVPLDEAPDPGKRCTLKPQSFFQDCLAAITGEPQFPSTSQGYGAPNSLAFECAFGDGYHERTSHLLWFESCEDESPIACE